MNITVRADENEDGCIDTDALALMLRFVEMVGPDHTGVGSDSRGVSVEIDDEGARELLYIIREGASR